MHILVRHSVCFISWCPHANQIFPKLRATYKCADKSLARPTSLCISFDAGLVLYIYIYIYSTNIPPIMIINMIYENKNLLLL